MIKGVIFDIDGVLEFQGLIYPGAVETVRALGERGLALRFLTNSTLKSHTSAAEKLARQGFPISPEQVITASSAAAEYLRQQKPRSIWLLQAREGVEEFKEFVVDAENPEYVVIGDARSGFSFENLNHALRLLHGGAKLVGMQPELIDHSLGALELNVGSWVGMLERASGKPAVHLGKPNPFVFELSLRSMGLEGERDQVLVVGDQVQTDILGARQAGLPSALVKTGEFRPEVLEAGPRPDYELRSIEELLELL